MRPPYPDTPPLHPGMPHLQAGGPGMMPPQGGPGMPPFGAAGMMPPIGATGMMPPHPFRNYAFISYSHSDLLFAQTLQKLLEKFDLPEELPNECLPGSSHLRPIFRDKTDLNAGVLQDALKQHLEESKFLIVIASRQSAKSDWVNREVQMFIDMGRVGRIIPVVVDGTPYSNDENECLPIALRSFVAQFPDRELLCVDIAQEGTSRAIVAIASRILGVPFDYFYNRHQRQRRLSYLLWSLGVVVSSVILFLLTTPVQLKLHLLEEEHSLPPCTQAVLIVNNEYRLLDKLDTTLVFDNISARLRGKSVEIHFEAPFYDTIQMKCPLGYGVTKELDLALKRDATFEVFEGHVIDEDGDPISGVLVKVAGTTAMTDELGHFAISLPLSVQAVEQSILLMKDGYTETYREDECPSTELIYIMYQAQ